MERTTLRMRRPTGYPVGVSTTAADVSKSGSQLSLPLQRALPTASVSVKPYLPLQHLEVHMNAIDLPRRELVDKVSPGDARDLRGPSLRYDSPAEPVDRSRQTYLSLQLDRRLL